MFKLSFSGVFLLRSGFTGSGTAFIGDYFALRLSLRKEAEEEERGKIQSVIFRLGTVKLLPFSLNDFNLYQSNTFVEILCQWLSRLF